MIDGGRVPTDTELAVDRSSVLERSIQVDGVLTRYLSAGTGPALVLLHGAGDNAHDWSYVLPLLGRSHRVLAPDLPGYSPGSNPAADYSPARLARFVARFMDAVGLDRAAVAGNSLGGLAALQLALSDPERITALCLVDSAGLGRAVNPALVAQCAPGIGELAIAVGRRRPGAALRAARGRYCCSGVHGGRPGPGCWSSTGPLADPGSWRPRWPACAPSSGSSANARCWPSDCLS
jgi:pimeloyl-ACP methyl ester carboxylesterase